MPLRDNGKARLDSLSLRGQYLLDTLVPEVQRHHIQGKYLLDTLVQGEHDLEEIRRTRTGYFFSSAPCLLSIGVKLTTSGRISVASGGSKIS